MWLLFHHERGTKVLPGGHTFVEDCPTCKRSRRFREVEITEKQGIWFLDLDDDKRRAYRCDGCGDVFDLREQAEMPERPAPPARAAALPPSRREDPALAERRREEERVARENRIEDELAELKKRLGR